MNQSGQITRISWTQGIPPGRRGDLLHQFISAGWPTLYCSNSFGSSGLSDDRMRSSACLMGPLIISVWHWSSSISLWNCYWQIMFSSSALSCLSRSQITMVDCLILYLDRIAVKQVHAYQGHVPVCACVCVCAFVYERCIIMCEQCQVQRLESQLPIVYSVVEISK